jgi:oligopeptide/dipeptide ABC transporter ATP-binding protein
MVNLPGGCIFADRCPMRFEACATRPAMAEARTGHKAACHLIKVEETA